MRNILIATALLALASQPSLAAMETDCDALFVKADIDKNGSLNDSEASLYMNALAKAGRPATAPLARDAFLTECKADAFKENMAAAEPASTTVAATTEKTVSPNTTDAATTVVVPMAALIVGANSFTEAQAVDRLGKNGLSAVAQLTKGDDGIWRGTATKDGKAVKVGLDFKGHVAFE